MQQMFQALQTINLPQDSGRIFHGRGGKFLGAEHLCLDWYAPVLLLTSFLPLTDEELAQVKVEIQNFLTGQGENIPQNLVYQCRYQGDTRTEILFGKVPEPHIIAENGNHYLIHLLKGQNHGLFLDMRNGRQWVQAHSKSKRVLNLFAYTCGFSVAAMQGGATRVINLDMSKGALIIGQQNHQLNNCQKGVSFLSHDIFKSWSKLRKLGPYDLVIVDPPSYQKGSFVATNDYLKLLRRLPDLLAPDAELLLCLNSPDLDTQFLKQQVSLACSQLSYVERLPNPDVFADLDEEKALKVLRYRY